MGKDAGGSKDSVFKMLSPEQLKALSPEQLEGLARGLTGGGVAGGVLTEEVLARAIAGGTEIALKNERERTPETIDMAIAKAKGEMTQMHKRPTLKQEKIPVRSDETGATFVADVQYSDAYPAGRVIVLENYNPPEGWEGRAPTNLPPKRPDGRPNIFFLDWKRREYWDRDCRRFLGRPLPLHCRLPEGTQVPTPAPEASVAQAYGAQITKNTFPLTNMPAPTVLPGA